jgi:3-hydroxy-3-methylglutaryl CoA synthase
MSEIGITGFGAYIPRLRLERQRIVDANTWINAGLKAYARGARSMCNWDEDAVTMAVDAARDGLSGVDRSTLHAVHVASTSLPFSDRQNAGVIAEALNLPEAVATLDIGSSQRAGTSALVNALSAARTAKGPVLVVAAEHRRTRTGSVEEVLYGDGAAALLVGKERVIAKPLGAYSLSVDFVDHYRGQNHEFEYGWEERWVRDEGYLKIAPRAIERALAEARVAPEAIDRFILPCPLARVPEAVAQAVGIRADAVADSLQADCGMTGAAHPILQLAHALEMSKPGDRILVAGWGQGLDVVVLEVTDAIRELAPRRGVGGALRRRRAETNYDKFMTFNGLLNKDLGKRAEGDRQTALSTLYRNRGMLTGFVGGKCGTCGTVQFPRAHYCVSPDCDALDSQSTHPMADTPGRVLTWTADFLTFSPDPPAYFGMVEFEGGGRVMLDFSDVDPETLDIGVPIRMQFRIREIDDERGFRKYFWKAAQA